MTRRQERGSRWAGLLPLLVFLACCGLPLIVLVSAATVGAFLERAGVVTAGLVVGLVAVAGILASRKRGKDERCSK
jgi:hypothetical protein